VASSKKVSIITLGCPKNASDTSNLARLLKARGYEIVSDAAEADTAIHVDAATVQKMNLQTAVVARGPVRRQIRTVGVVEFNERGLRDVDPRCGNLANWCILERDSQPTIHTKMNAIYETMVGRPCRAAGANRTRRS